MPCTKYAIVLCGSLLTVDPPPFYSFPLLLSFLGSFILLSARLYFHGEEMRAHANERKGSPSLVWALTKAFGGAFFLGGVFKLFNDLLTFVSPQILK